MSRIRLFVLGALAVTGVIAVSAIGSASASAAEPACSAGSTNLFTLCLEEGGSLVEGPKLEKFVSVKESGSSSFFKSELGGKTIRVECTKAVNTGEFEQTALVATVLVKKLEVSFSTCNLTGSATEVETDCVVKEPVELKNVGGMELGGEDTEQLDVEFTPESGTEFTKIDLLNNGSTECPATVSGESKIKGEQLCELLEAEKDLVSHLLDCEPAGSNLTFGSGAAVATFELVELVSLSGQTGELAKWDISLS